MKRSILAGTALCGALMSPAVGAIDFSRISNADYWELRHTICRERKLIRIKLGAKAINSRSADNVVLIAIQKRDYFYGG